MLEIAGIWILGFIFGILPRPLAILLAKAFGYIAFGIFRIGRWLTMMNLKDAFPGRSLTEYRRIGRASMVNLAMIGMEMLRARWSSKERVLSHVNLDPESESLVHEIMAEGKGVVFVGGHYSNWELLGALTAAVGYPAVAIVQEQRNPYLNKMVNRIRRKLGITVLTRGAAVKHVFRILKEGGAVMILADQEATPEYGIFTDFFGKPAAAFQGPAVFAERYNAPLIMALITRYNGSYYASYKRLDLDALADLEPDAGAETRIRRLTESWVKCLEACIREDPGQYFWLHRRWEFWENMER